MTRMQWSGFELRPAARLSAAAIGASGLSAGWLVSWADGAVGLVALAAVVAMLVHVVGVMVGLRSAIGVAACMMCGSAVINVAAADEAVWVESLVTGLLIYFAAELGWEAIDRRDGSRRTTEAWRWWVAQRTLVALLSLVVAVTANLVAQSAPVRSVLLQAVVAIGALVVMVAGMQRLAADDRSGVVDRADQLNTDN